GALRQGVHPGVATLRQVSPVFREAARRFPPLPRDGGEGEGEGTRQAASGPATTRARRPNPFSAQLRACGAFPLQATMGGWIATCPHHPGPLVRGARRGGTRLGALAPSLQGTAGRVGAGVNTKAA